MSDVRFDIRDEPWIPVQYTDGRTGEESLSGAFAHAHEIADILGDIPTQGFAIKRLLLAVLYAALDPGADDDPVAAWERLWRSEALPVERIEQYLRDSARDDRFDLFHPSAPFYQTAGLRTGKGEVSGLERIIADVPNRDGYRYLSMRHGAGLASIGFAEATRWLVHTQSYDTAGNKTGVVGDPRANAGKIKSHGKAWAGELGGLTIEGASLRETLLLNLAVRGSESGEELRPGRPVWDRAPSEPGPERADGAEEERRPSGIAELYTWQSRRVLLHRDGDRVDGVVLTYGDALHPVNMHAMEMMTSWRLSEPQAKKLGVATAYMPRLHLPQRSMWRDLSAVLPQTEARGVPAGILSWAGELVYEGVLPRSATIGLRAAGVQYGTQSSVITAVIDDSVWFAPHLLTEEGHELAASALLMVAETEKVVAALAGLASNLVDAAGAGDSDGARSRARELAYAELDRPYRRWLSGLRPESDAEEERARWVATARGILRRLGDRLIEDAGEVALVGRVAPDGTLKNAALADLWFRTALARTFSDPSAQKEGNDA